MLFGYQKLEQVLHQHLLAEELGLSKYQQRVVLMHGAGVATRTGL